MNIIIDISVIGTAELYQHHKTGVYRVISQLLEQWKHSEHTIYLVSAGRAKWIELLSYTAYVNNYKSSSSFTYSQRSSFVPFLNKPLQALTRRLLKLKETNILSPKQCAGLIKIMGLLLKENPSIPQPGNNTIYFSPAHPFPAWSSSYKRAIIIHDIIPLKFPEYFPNPNAFKNVIESIQFSHDGVICPSESTLNDLKDHIKPTHISHSQVAHLGISKPHPSIASSIIKKSNLKKASYLLSVGTLEPRKNLISLVKAFHDIIKADQTFPFPLVLTGEIGWKNAELFEEINRLKHYLKMINRENLFIFTGFISDTELEELYSNARLFIFPSLYEGFGLPILEAMSQGTPVLCGKNSSLPEVGGSAVQYCTVTDHKELAESIRSISQNIELLENMKTASLIQSHKFTWANTAENCLTLFQKILGII